MKCASSGAGPPNWSSVPGPNGPSRKVLQLPRRPLSPMMMYSLPSGPKRITPPSWLPRRAGRFGLASAVSFWNARKHDDVAVERQRRAVPDEAIDTIAEQRHARENGGVDTRAALGPVEIHQRSCREVGMQRDAEQSALAAGVHRKIEHGAGDYAVDHALHPSRGFLGDEEIIAPEKGHRNRLIESGHDRRDAELRIAEGLR